MPYKRRYRRRRVRFRKKNRKRYYKSKKKYYKKKRISKRSYALNRQQLLSVATIKKICKRQIIGWKENMVKVKSPEQYINNNGNFYWPITFLTYPGAQVDSLTLDTNGIYRDNLISTTEVTIGGGVNEILGNSYIAKAIMYKFRIKWSQAAQSTNIKLRWYLIKCRARAGGADLPPIINGSLFKGNFMSPTERQFKKIRQLLGYTIVKRGTFYPPRTITNTPLKGQLTTSTGQTFIQANNANYHLTYVQDRINPLSANQNPDNVVQYPPMINTLTHKVLYFKFNKKINLKNLPEGPGVPDYQTQLHAGSSLLRYFLIMFKDSYPTNLTDLSDVSHVGVQTQKTFYYADDQ